MDLLVAVFECAAVVNVRLAHRASASEGDRSGRTEAGAFLTAAVIGSAHAILDIDSVARRDAIAEVQKPIRWIVQPRQFGRGQDPDADAITVCGRTSARLEATWFVAVFDVHAEQAGSRLSGPAGADPVADARERDLVSRRAPRLWSGIFVTGIANAIGDDTVIIEAVYLQIRAQTGTI